MSGEFEAPPASDAPDPHWEEAGTPGEWTAACAGKEAYIREVAGEYEARVYRHPTGPDGPEPELAHSPQSFASAQEALDWCDAHFGAPPGSQRDDNR